MRIIQKPQQKIVSKIQFFMRASFFSQKMVFATFSKSQKRYHREQCAVFVASKMPKIHPQYSWKFLQRTRIFESWKNPDLLVSKKYAICG